MMMQGEKSGGPFKEGKREISIDLHSGRRKRLGGGEHIILILFAAPPSLSLFLREEGRGSLIIAFAAVLKTVSSPSPLAKKAEVIRAKKGHWPFAAFMPQIPVLSGN